MADDVIRQAKGRVILELDVEAAEWLAMELPQDDGFTREVWAATEEAKVWLGAKAEEPRVVLTVQLRD